MTQPESDLGRHRGSYAWSSDRPAGRAFAGVLLAAALATMLIGWTSARSLETCWDEQVDRQIAVGLRHHPLTGGRPTLDGSQMRLPMYVNALAFAVTGRDDLAASRAVSLLFAGITVIATGLLGRRLFGPLAGGLAAVLLAFSPYFLAFGRIAMTEGDIFFACFLTLAAWGFVRYAQSPTAGSWLTAAILAGLAVGAKLYAVVPLAALALTAAVGERRIVAGVVGGLNARRKDLRRLRLRLAWAAVAIIISAGTAFFAHSAAVQDRNDLAEQVEWAACSGWWVVFVLWCSLVVLVLRRNVLSGSRAERLVGLAAAAVVTLFALLPAHLTAHGIGREVLRSLLNWNHETPLARWADHWRLYSGIVLLKLTIPLGILTILALGYAAVRAWTSPRWRICFLPVLGYVVVLCLLPLRQTFYLMGVYPLLMILIAAFAVQAGRTLRRRSGAAAAAWVVLLVGLLIHLGVRVQGAYPYYHLYGYDLVGDRWLGAESRGYRNLIQTPSDGVESLIHWCNTDPRVRPGSRVVSFLWEDAIIGELLPPSPSYVFVPRGLSPDSAAIPPPPSIEGADFILLHINNRLGYGDRSPDWPLEGASAGQFEPVYTVYRGALAVAWVYARRTAPP